MNALNMHHIQITLSLISIALGNKPSSEQILLFNTPINWANVYRFASKHGVLAITWDGLHASHRLGIITDVQMPDKKIKLRWALSVERIEERYRKQKQVLRELSKLYSSENIKLTILKGYGLSLHYPIPEHRECGDLDIWLDGAQQQADKLVQERFNVNIEVDKHHHTVFHINGVMVENHYDFLNIQTHRSNRDIEKILKELVEQNKISIELDDTQIYMPNATCHALFLIRHSAAHFAAAEIMLRHVIDWSLFIKHNYNTIDWTQIYRVCKEHKMIRFLGALNTIATKVCNLPQQCVPSIETERDLEQRIYNDILSPEFSEKMPTKGRLQKSWYKMRRWWANRWKHSLVYRENTMSMFIVHLYSHFTKPNI